MGALIIVGIMVGFIYLIVGVMDAMAKKLSLSVNWRVGAMVVSSLNALAIIALVISFLE